MSKIQISRLNNVYDTNPTTYNLDVIFKEIKQGNATITNHHTTAENFQHRTLKAYTEYYRELMNNPYKQLACQNLKKYLPQIIPAGILNTRSEIHQFIGIVCLEYDNPDLEFDHILAEAAQNPHTLAACRSISGKVKLLIKVALYNRDGTSLSHDTFKYAWHAAHQLFEHLGDADINSCNPTQLQAFCYDPFIYTPNVDTKTLNWHIDKDAFKKKYGKVFSGKAEYAGTFDKLDDKYRETITQIQS